MQYLYTVEQYATNSGLEINTSSFCVLYQYILTFRSDPQGFSCFSNSFSLIDLRQASYPLPIGSSSSLRSYQSFSPSSNSSSSFFQLILQLPFIIQVLKLLLILNTFSLFELFTEFLFYLHIIYPLAHARQLSSGIIKFFC